MKVSNLTSPSSGAKVANQYNVEVNGVDYFQSYDTVIARYKMFNLEVTDDYNYSNTTSKYFRQWLRQWNFSDKEVDNLKKLLKNSTPNCELTWTLESGNEVQVYFTKDGFNL